MKLPRTYGVKRSLCTRVQCCNTILLPSTLKRRLLLYVTCWSTKSVHSLSHKICTLYYTTRFLFPVLPATSPLHAAVLLLLLLLGIGRREIFIRIWVRGIRPSYPLPFCRRYLCVQLPLRRSIEPRDGVVKCAKRHLLSRLLFAALIWPL